MKDSTYHPAKSLGYLVNRTAKLMGNTLKAKLIHHDYEVPVEHWGIMLQLGAEDGMTQQQIVDQILKDKGTVARAISSLEKKNIVIRVQDDMDKRHRRIFLTENGKKLQQAVWPLAQMTIEESTKGIAKEEIQICIKVLNKIYNNLKK